MRDLPRKFLLAQLEAYYAAKPSETLVQADYSLWQCAETGLEFAWPMLPGNAAFYEWVSSFASYYPGIRWEYGTVRQLLSEGVLGDAGSLKILDVGCGKGDFLRGLSFVPAHCRFALDLNQPAVEACRQQGFRAFCGTMETAMQAGFVAKRGFPAVTSFHCLEHVDQPVAFVRALADATMAGGRIYLSTPHSPMSFESDWFDILNHPPHHMTRWNLRSYQRLADLLGLKMRHFVPPSQASKRALAVFRLLQYGPNRRVSRLRYWTDIMRHLPRLLELYRQQLDRNQKGIGADVILVELTVP